MNKALAISGVLLGILSFSYLTEDVVSGSVGIAGSALIIAGAVRGGARERRGNRSRE